MLVVDVLFPGELPTRERSWTSLSRRQSRYIDHASYINDSRDLGASEALSLRAAGMKSQAEPPVWAVASLIPPPAARLYASGDHVCSLPLRVRLLARMLS